jgi:SP family arabinose:H+ symporter-like MFS transporter
MKIESKTPCGEPQPSLPASGSRWFLAGICLVASIGGLLFGFDTAVISGTFGFVEAQYALNKFLVGWFGSSALVGCILGAAVAGALSDRFGRKPILVIAAVLFFVSALYSAIPPNYTVLIIARIVGGLGVGMASVLAPMYIAEFAPPHLRGRLVALYQLSIVVGILAAYFSNWALLAFSQTGSDLLPAGGWLHHVLVAEVWRGMFGAEMLPAALFIFLLLLAPESPRWLAQAGRHEQALWVLARINGRQAAETELATINETLRCETGTIGELFQPGLRMALVVALGLSIFGQMTGVNVVIYYGPTILESAGLPLTGALQYQVALGLINLVFTLIAIWKVDHWGRRPLLVGGMAAVTLSMAATALLLLLGVKAIWVVVCLGIYIACVAVSICGVIWVLTPEIFPNQIRGRAMSIATLANWATNTVSALLFPWYVERLGVHTGFFTFAAICLVATVFFWLLVPETKGKSLEEITRHWLPSD